MSGPGTFGIRRLTGDTLAALQDRQLQMERMFRQTAQEKAKDYIDWYGGKHEWTQEELEEVLGALGLIES